MTDDASALRRARHLDGVSYEIRGPLVNRALDLERQGHSIIKLNIGNPAAFGFRMPEAIRLAIARDLDLAGGYTHQKGIALAREAVVAAAVARGLDGAHVDRVFLGNGVSELILMCLQALLEPGDDVLVPAPDYPLWTAAVRLTGARAVHYPCRPENGFVPDVDEVAACATANTRAIVVISPNNPTGAVYPRATIAGLAALAERNRWVAFSDEIYDRLLYNGAEHASLAEFCEGALAATFGGLSKVHRACGIRSGWVSFTGATAEARDYLEGIELLASLRLCPNAPGQYGIAAALGGASPSAEELTADTGRLGKQRRAVLDGVTRSEFLSMVPPRGALYAFPAVDVERVPAFDDALFAMELLDREHVLVVPGSSFHVPYRNHLRLTMLPDEATIADVMVRVDRLLAAWSSRPPRASVDPPGPVC